VTTDGWKTWIQQSTPHVLQSISCTDAENCTAVGFDGIILRTTDGGTTWNQQSTGTIGQFLDVSFTDADNGTVVGNYGVIFRTTDGGVTWNQQIVTENALYAVCFNDADYGTAVGEYGTILHTKNGGATFVEEEQIDEVPKTYSLSNNFPNPFNPSTKIRYSVSRSTLVQIKVYDILGNEIETLVNEEKPAGIYELNWNAVALPSGVYFYRIIAGSFIQTRKMILLK
jgi:hypothetical protein